MLRKLLTLLRIQNIQVIDTLKQIKVFSFKLELDKKMFRRCIEALKLDLNKKYIKNVL